MTNEEVLNGVLKAKQYQTAAWLQVIEKARKYAQMKAHCSYIENDNNCTVGKNDQEWYLQSFKEQLLWEIDNAYREDAALGAAIFDASTEK